MTTYAVGDLQGCLDPLLCLLKEVNFDPQTDRLWLVGDLVNRGPQSLATLEYLYELRHCVVSVLGNHDLHLLAYAYGHRAPSRGDTLDDIIHSPKLPLWLDWLRQMPLLYWDEQFGCALVHAGIPPQWNIDQALALSGEVEACLKDDQALDGFLANMYGNTPSQWRDDLTGTDRLRTITNYFTRMRFCDAQGQLELKHKGEPATAPEGFQPWFEHYLQNPDNPTVIFGHWAALDGATHSHRAIGLDTGCVWGNNLTMLCLETGQRWQCDCP